MLFSIWLRNWGSIWKKSDFNIPSSMKLSPIFLCGLSLLVWMGVIFFFSAFPGSEYPYQVTLSYYMERKGAHVVEYATLMFLTVRFVFALFPRETFKKVFLLAGVFSITYGATDELHQFFVPYRGALFSDVLIDSLGVLLMGTFLLFIRVVSQRKKWACFWATKNSCQGGKSFFIMRKGLLHCFSKFLKYFRILYGHLGKHLAIESNILGFFDGDKFTIHESVQA